MKYNSIETILFEYDEKSINSSILAYRTFEGSKNKIKVELVRYNNDKSPEIKIYSLNDPNDYGVVRYNSKIDAILAYNNLKSLTSVINYMNKYKLEPDCYKFMHILSDEDNDLLKTLGNNNSQLGNYGNISDEGNMESGNLNIPSATPETPITPTETPPETTTPETTNTTNTEIV